MENLEVAIKGTAGEPIVLTFTAGDSADAVNERLRTLAWIIRQVSGAPAEVRRRGVRSGRDADAPSSAATTTTVTG